MGRALHYNSTLCELNMRLNRLGDMGGRVLLDGLVQNTTLTSINLSRYNGLPIIHHTPVHPITLTRTLTPTLTLTLILPLTLTLTLTLTPTPTPH